MSDTEKAARDYAKYHSGVTPVTTIGEKIRAAFTAGAEHGRLAALEEEAEKAVAEAWDEGFQAGIDQEAFDSRGLPTDHDADTFPRTNPYRVDQIGER